MSNSFILLVEDNPADVTLTMRAFRKSNILNEVVIAEDGVQAVDILLGKPDAPLPQIILLDLKLPRMDGLQVLQRIRASERTRLLPVIILTSSSEEADLIS